jgi:hypothetical protein
LVAPTEILEHNIAVAHVSDCERPLIVISGQASFTPTATLFNYTKPGDRIYFAYLDWLSTKPDRLAVLRRRIGAPVLAMLGLSPYSNSREMLFISEPGECDIVKQVDWSMYWKP